MASESALSAAKEPGRLGRTLIRLLMRRATVVANEALGDRYRLVTLDGPDFRGVEWIPGQKVQIAMGSAFVTRTYTPIDWDAAGRLRILGYVHGNGPGSAWIREARPGDECDILGPRASLDVRRSDGPIAVYGDETSIGLAYAAIHAASRPVACHFEVEDAQASGEVVEKLGIAAATTLHERRAGDEHIADMEESLTAGIAADARFVLTGKAGTIQRLRQRLKQQAVPAARIATKAYWAPGKRGLD